MKNLKIKINLALSVSSVVFSLIYCAGARAGVDSSGGGNALVCRGVSQEILTAQVLDLYEGKILYSQTPVVDSRPAAEQTRDQIAKLISLNKFTTVRLDEIAEHVLQSARILPEGVALNPINDSFPPIYQKGCSIEQLAAYLSDGTLHINGEIWRALGETDRAALYVHEALYKMMRDRGATDSIRTRKIVGHLFSGFAFAATSASNENFDRICVTPGKAFWNAPTVIAVKITEKAAEVSFITLAGNSIFDRKELKVPAELFGSGSPGTGIYGMGWLTGKFESGDYAMIENVNGKIALQLSNGLGDSRSKGRFEVDCQ